LVTNVRKVHQVALKTGAILGLANSYGHFENRKKALLIMVLTLAHQIYEASCQNHLDLPVRHRMLCNVSFFFRFVHHLHLASATDCFTQIGQDEDIILIDSTSQPDRQR
jgi:hypothetical protein